MPSTERIVALFGLSPFERELLLLAAGIEMDDALRRAVAQTQGVAAEQAIGIDYALALDVLSDPHWNAISPLGPLRHWQLLIADTSGGLAHAPLRIDERVLHYVAGVDGRRSAPRWTGAAYGRPTAPGRSTRSPPTMRLARCAGTRRRWSR